MVSDKNIRAHRFDELHKMLEPLGYPSSLIAKAIDKFKDANPKTLRSCTKKREKDIISYITTFDNSKSKFYGKVVRPGIQLLQGDMKCKNILKKNKFVCCYRQRKSIGRRLCNRDIKPQDHGVFYCSDKRCATCISLIIEINLLM